MKTKETIEWYKVELRTPTEEELEIYGEECTYMLNCPTPEDGEKILIATKDGVSTDICCIDGYCGYFLENLGDWYDVLAWAHMPKYNSKE